MTTSDQPITLTADYLKGLIDSNLIHISTPLLERIEREYCYIGNMDGDLKAIRVDLIGIQETHDDNRTPYFKRVAIEFKSDFTVKQACNLAWYLVNDFEDACRMDTGWDGNERI
jgi:hypothetical protein